MENALRACCKGIKIGKILIHREGDNGQQLIYEKLPKDISDRHVLLLDPILGTGNSAVQAISLLIKKGVPESNIIFLNLISAPQGVHMVCKHFPRIKIVTSEIEIDLNKDFRVIPGMGEFGDRYFGTDDDDEQTVVPPPQQF
ncbi:uridine kinase-like 4 [Actinidia rufa]|uniref:Uridine kinase-like 4 n=1 Tax=Actinidia rufa TaxID=165716 RepID=A0A7J0DBK1_9ERIC|nr:uridine kinase-like 4 [Actinidia rufa]